MLFSRSKSRHDSLCKLCHWHRCSTIFNHGFFDRTLQRTLLSSLDIYRIAGTASHDVQCVCVCFFDRHDESTTDEEMERKSCCILRMVSHSSVEQTADLRILILCSQS